MAKTKFWWINDFNGIEYGGPFESAKEAKKKARASFKSIPGNGGYLIILKEVERYDARVKVTKSTTKRIVG